jgi:hypothetical protein
MQICHLTLMLLTFDIPPALPVLSLALIYNPKIAQLLGNQQSSIMAQLNLTYSSRISKLSSTTYLARFTYRLDNFLFVAEQFTLIRRHLRNI